MSYFLAAQATYSHIELGLYENSTYKGECTVPKREASSQLMVEIKKLLSKHQISCKELSFVGANQGPAPFTTLRVLISTLNGIALASNVPLVGVDGLQTFYNEINSSKYPQTVILLNAYSQDAYYAYKHNDKIITGWNNISKLLETINSIIPTDTIRFLGNGTSFFNQEIIDTFGNRAFFPQPMIEYTSLNAIAQAALKNFEAGKTTDQLLPLYLKKNAFVTLRG
jgi:tRNA threonylcarbamoyladenosine biosynthesis protein TsaB